MELSMELLSLLHAHDGICRFFDPYGLEPGQKDYVAEYYKQYFEERLSFLLLTLSVHLRTLDDRKLIGKYVHHEDPIQIELGQVLKGDTWEPIDNFEQF